MGRYKTDTQTTGASWERAAAFALLEMIFVGFFALVYFHLGRGVAVSETAFLTGLVGVSAFTATFFTIVAVAVDEVL